MKLEINNILSNKNKNKKINYKINKENSFNNSSYYNDKKKELNQSLQIKNYKNVCIIDKYPSSRNKIKDKNVKNINTSINNKIIKSSNNNNVNRKIKVIFIKI